MHLESQLRRFLCKAKGAGIKGKYINQLSRFKHTDIPLVSSLLKTYPIEFKPNCINLPIYAHTPSENKSNITKGGWEEVIKISYITQSKTTNYFEECMDTLKIYMANRQAKH